MGVCMDKDEKYLMGYILGDGMLRHYQGHGYEVKLTEKNYCHAEYLATLITKLYGIKPALVKEKSRKAWRIRIYRKELYDLIKQKLEMATKNPDEQLIGGLFDAEGDYTESKCRLRFTNKDPYIVKLVEAFLRKNHVVYHIYVRRRGKHIWYNIEIYGNNLLRLISKLDLRHPKWKRMYLHLLHSH